MNINLIEAKLKAVEQEIADMYAVVKKEKKSNVNLISIDENIPGTSIQQRGSNAIKSSMTLANTVDLQEKLRLAKERAEKAEEKCRILQEDKPAYVERNNMQWLEDSSDEEFEEQDPEKALAEELAVKLRVPKTPRQLDYSIYRAAQLRHSARNPPPKNIKEFDGVVTQFFEDEGSIDHKVYFYIGECLTYDAPLPFNVGDKVHVKAKLRRPFDDDEQIDDDDWVAFSVQLLEPASQF